MSLGTNMAAAFLLLGGAGYYFDRKHGGGYTWTLCGVLLAIVYSGYEVWKVVRAMDEEEQRAHSRDAGQEDDSAEKP